MLATSEVYEFFIGEMRLDVCPEADALSKKPHLVIWKEHEDADEKLGVEEAWGEPEVVEFETVEDLALAQAGAELIMEAIRRNDDEFGRSIGV